MSDIGLFYKPGETFGIIKPVITEEIGVNPPENSELRKIAEDVLQAAQYTFAAVAANPTAAVEPNSLASAFRDALQNMNESRRTNYQTHAQQLVRMDVAARQMVFGRYGVMEAEDLLAKDFMKADAGLPTLQLDTKLLGMSTPTIAISSNMRLTDRGVLIPLEGLPGDFESLTQDWEEAHVESMEQGIVSERIQEIWGPVYKTDPFADTNFEDFEGQADLDKLGFYITEIKCNDETNPEWWGHDEIAIAGVSIDEDGQSHKIAEKWVRGGFDDGDVKTYSPHWRYEAFNMREGKYWPKKYTLTLLLAEKDWGGFSTALDKIWKAIGDSVKVAIEKAIAGLLQSYVGQAIANAIGKAVAWIVDKFIGWIIKLFQDDIFPAMVRSVTVPSLSARWYYPNGTWGCPYSPRGRVHTYGHGGHYSIEYYWKMFS